jgi:hypothetical protein
MSHQGKFNRRLNRLYQKRTGWLRTVLTKANPGPIPTLTKSQREHAIGRLQEIASNALAKKMAKKVFQRSVEKRKTWMTKGWGAGTPKCPLCALHKKIKTDLRRIFRFR